MRIERPKLLAAMRVIGPCESCRKFGQLEVAHVFACGMGDASRLDIRINLVALGRGPWAWEYGLPMTCACHHHNHHLRRPNQHDLLEIVAAREGLREGDIVAAIRLIQNLPRDARPWQVDVAFSSYDASAEVRRLVTEALEGAA